MWTICISLVIVFQWSHNGDCALSPHWTTVPHCSCRNFGSSNRLRCENYYIDNSMNSSKMFVFYLGELRLLSCLKEISKSQPSSLWWPEHCKDESKLNLHHQQADVYRILKGLLCFCLCSSKYYCFTNYFSPSVGSLFASSSNHECVIYLGIYSTGELPSGTVLGLTVDDPRLTLPRKMVKALPCVQQAEGKIWPTRQTVETVKFTDT